MSQQVSEVVEGADPYPRASKSLHLLTLLVLTCVIAYIDAQIFALLVSPIKHDLALSDAQLGTLQGVALYLSGGIASIPLAYFVDRHSRITFLRYATFAWSGCTAFSILSSGFWELFICRLGVGVAEAGLYSAAYSLIADLYPPRQRANAIFTFFAGVLCGASLAAFLGGTLIGYIDNWRAAFIAVAIPGFVLSLIFFKVKEPRRHGHIGASVAEPVESFDRFLRAHGAMLSYLGLGMFMVMVGHQALVFWMPTILTRVYGISLSRSGQLFGVAFGVGSIGGTLLAAGLTRFLLNRHGDATQLQVFRVSFLAAAVIFPLLLLAKTSIQLLLGWIALVGIVYIAMSSWPTLITNVTPNHFRGRILAMWNLLAINSAASMAPPVAGAVSDHFYSGPNGVFLACCLIGIPCCVMGPILLSRVHDLPSVVD